MNKLIFIFFLGVFFISNSNAQELKPSNYSEILNLEFTGELAYETTEFVEKYWRVVGNTGFDKSVYFIAEHLEKAGFVLEEKATEKNKLTYRIEKRPLKSPTWEVVDGFVKIIGEDEPLLQQSSNRNMIALNSCSTPKGGVEAEVIYVDDVKKIRNLDVKGKIVFAESSPYLVFSTAVLQGGALGILTYDNPAYLQPEKNVTSIQFRSIQLKPEQKSWAIALSFAAKERLKAQLLKGKVNLHVDVETKIYESEELTIIADIKGSDAPKERLVFSAHIQEPGANDNATGVGVALEMATLTAKFIEEGTWTPKRTLTFLWGDEIVSTGRYVQEDKERAKNIKWGISLDMVGENTVITGGSFLIEKMPDPSSIWTRGNDKHTEWGSSPMTLNQMKPHYLNDFLIRQFQFQGKLADWKVNTNPYEGGSDHTPFLEAGIPGVLFWHFTDQFYHTDNDRLDKVSKTTLKNVGTAALVCAYILVNSDETTAEQIIKSTEEAGVTRLNEELNQGRKAIQNGESVAIQIKIIEAWEDWYLKAISNISDMVSDKELLKKAIEKSQEVIKANAMKIIECLKE
ncbi:MAG: M28 family peptidase [Aquaticitalea sp.]